MSQEVRLNTARALTSDSGFRRKTDLGIRCGFLWLVASRMFADLEG